MGWVGEKGGLHYFMMQSMWLEGVKDNASKWQLAVRQAGNWGQPAEYGSFFQDQRLTTA